jgi:hypothetical protein
MVGPTRPRKLAALLLFVPLLSHLPAQRPVGPGSSAPDVAAGSSAELAAPRQAPPRSASTGEMPSFSSTPLDPAAWQRFLDAHPGRWESRWCRATGTPSAIYGTGLRLSEPVGDLDAARRHAARVLERHHDLLGIGRSELLERIGARMGATWCLVYAQSYAGLPVLGGRVDVRVHETGRVSMFGSCAWEIPDAFDPAPAITPADAAESAVRAARRRPDAREKAVDPDVVGEPRLVIWGDVHAAQRQAVRLAFEVRLRAVGAAGQVVFAGRSVVDARTGDELSFVSDVHECGFGCRRGTGSSDPRDVLRRREAAAELRSAARIRSSEPPSTNTNGVVQAWARIGNSASSPLGLVPLPQLTVDVPGRGLRYTDPSGQFTETIGGPVTVALELAGRRTARVEGVNQPLEIGTLSPGATTTFTFLNGFATNPSVAHTTAYYWITRVNEFARSILGSTPELDLLDGIQAFVNLPGIGAYYTGLTVNLREGGGTYSHTAFASVIAHEWAHGLDEVHGGVSQVQGLGEGWADAVAMYLLDDPRIGLDYEGPGLVLRDGNNTVSYPASGGVHHMGKTWMGFAWKLRGTLEASLGSRPAANAAANAILLPTIVADQAHQPGALLEVFLADDDDGNLANGTPHSTELIQACLPNAMPYPTIAGPPANDTCALAIQIVDGINGPFRSDGATTTGPAWPLPNVSRDVWFVYDAGSAGALTVTTCGRAVFNTAIEVSRRRPGRLLRCADEPRRRRRWLRRSG